MAATERLAKRDRWQRMGGTRFLVLMVALVLVIIAFGVSQMMSPTKDTSFPTKGDGSCLRDQK